MLGGSVEGMLAAVLSEWVELAVEDMLAVLSELVELALAHCMM